MPNTVFFGGGYDLDMFLAGFMIHPFEIQHKATQLLCDVQNRLMFPMLFI